ncbi:MAG: hypothetical protein ABIG11_04945 [bacterium]
MEEVEDYIKLERLPKTEGQEVLVRYSGLIHRMRDGNWVVVGREAKG